MYFAMPASEYVVGGRDPGVYISEGIQIAQRQSLLTTDPVVAAVPQPTRDLFFPFYGEAGYHSLRFMGFHLRDPETGTVSGQFPQGYPIWIAIAYGLDGVTGTRRVTAWWAILGVLAVYFAGARLIGPLPAAAAAGCSPCTSFKRGTRAIRIPRSSRSRCCLRRFSATPTRTKMRIGFLAQLRPHCWGSRSLLDFLPYWRSEPRLLLRCWRR